MRVRGVLPSLLAVLLIGACSGARAEPPAPRVAVTVRVTTVEVGPKELVVMNEVFREATFDPVGTLTDEDAPTHDQNGNRIAEDDLRLVFDAFDRLIRVVRRADNQTIGRYRYDAFGRRVERVFEDPATGLTEEVLYVSDGAQEIEELDAQGNLRADYVYGARYIDEVCQVRRPDGAGGFEELYLHQSSIFTVHAVTDASGNVVERYRYGSIYGAVTVTDGGGGARAPPDEVGNPWRFQGRRFDAETGFYFFRRRYLDPEAGRFVSRDPLGLWGDPGNLGNAYVFCGDDPVNCVDPNGLQRVLSSGPGRAEGDPGFRGYVGAPPPRILVHARLVNRRDDSTAEAVEGVATALTVDIPNAIVEAPKAILTDQWTFATENKELLIQTGPAAPMVMGARNFYHYIIIPPNQAAADAYIAFQSGDVKEGARQTTHATLGYTGQLGGGLSLSGSIRYGAAVRGGMSTPRLTYATVGPHNTGAMTRWARESASRMGIDTWTVQVGYVRHFLGQTSIGWNFTRNPFARLGGHRASLERASLGVDAGFFNPTPGLARLGFEDRLQVVLAHEYTELIIRDPTLGPCPAAASLDAAAAHGAAIQHAPSPPLNISINTRRYLADWAASGQHIPP